ncbi:MAG: DUF6933 domain-containing protein [Pseudonocardiaceae bacterium]
MSAYRVVVRSQVRTDAHNRAWQASRPSTRRAGHDGFVLVVRATRKLLAHVGGPTVAEDHRCTTQLGEWYATVLNWRRRVTLLVNEPTLLPVLLPLAPAATWTSRLAQQIAANLTAHDAPTQFITAELRHMQHHRLDTTANRSVVGVMNEFAYLAEAYRHDTRDDLLDLSLRLSATPCGPLYRENISPDRELAATLRSSRT